MSQAQIINLLLETKRPMFRTEIAVALNLSPALITKRLARLLKFKEISFIEINGRTAWEKYKIKRRTRLYFVVT